MSKRVERALFRGELLSVLREQVVVLRRIAAVMERDALVQVDVERESSGG
ncbi:hypothetical protein [Rhodococcus sp. 15-649-2-2]|nr:hypothetical protein [Rhodococcus sp. 15-649-2-2]